VTLPTQSVRVQLSERSYDIEIGSGTIHQAGSFLVDRVTATMALVITDENVESPHAENVARSLEEAGADAHMLVVDPGEGSKSVDVVSQLWETMLDIGADRKSVVVAVGGGVIGDLAGFAAAAFARGIPLFQIPTTLLAQVDSSVGGKTGVNLPGAKNMVGAFWQPLGVLIDTDVLETLPDREYRSGLAEVVKYGVILDADFFAYLEANVAGLNERDAEVLRTVVARCCRLKADVVEADEREETGHRAVLNYGHTFCHALEAATGYGQLLHGEAVSIGMLCASRLAERLAPRDSPDVNADFTRRQHDLLAALDLPTVLPDVDHDQLIELMQHDKKVEHGRLRFVLPTRLGHVHLVDDVADADVRAALEG
jgi:3-dehydroquinate synthase